MIILDTSGLLSAIDASQHRHLEAVLAREAGPPWVLSPFVLAEIDYLLASRAGVDAERALLEEVARGVYRLESFDEADVEAADRVVGRYRDLRSDWRTPRWSSSPVYGARDLLTLDERHFRRLRGPRGSAFRLLPADA